MERTILFGEIKGVSQFDYPMVCHYCDKVLSLITFRYFEEDRISVCPGCDFKHRPKTQITMPISFSNFDQFFKCSQRWSWFQQGLTTNMTDARRRRGGVLLHDVFHEYFVNLKGKRPKKKDIPALVKTEFKLAWRKSPILSLEKEIKTSCNNFIKMEEKRWIKERDAYIPTFTEQAIIALPFKGIIDWYEKTGIIRDWKTLRWFVPLKDSYKRQALIYTTLIRALGKEVKQIIFEETYHQKSVVINVYPGMDQELKGLVQHYKTSVENRLFKKVKTRVCNRYCPYQIRCEAQDQGQTLWKIKR